MEIFSPEGFITCITVNLIVHMASKYNKMKHLHECKHKIPYSSEEIVNNSFYLTAFFNCIFYIQYIIRNQTITVNNKVMQKMLAQTYFKIGTLQHFLERLRKLTRTDIANNIILYKILFQNFPARSEEKH
jgi:ferric iron reductase protein FhuF